MDFNVELVFLNPFLENLICNQSKYEIECITNKYIGCLATQTTIKQIEFEIDMWCARNNIDKSDYKIVWR